MGEVQGDESSRFAEYGRTVEFELIVGIAEALREEFGVYIDAHPGGQGVEAGVANRAFQVAVRRILQAIVTSEGDLPLVMTWALRQTALRRLAEHDVNRERAEKLLD